MVATVTGCLYFVDPTGVAKQTGIQATGILLMILNAFFLLVMGLLIAKAGALDALLQVQQGIHKVRASVVCVLKYGTILMQPPPCH